MKKKLLLSVSLFLLLFLGYSCSDDDYLSERDIQQMIDNSLNGQWQIVPVEIAGNDWQVFENEFESYHWVTVELPELTDYIFDEGLVHAYYKFDNNAKTGLPYVKTTVGNDGIPYTETYSCDFVLGILLLPRFTEASDAGLYDGEPARGFVSDYTHLVITRTAATRRDDKGTAADKDEVFLFVGGFSCRLYCLGDRGIGETL